MIRDTGGLSGLNQVAHQARVGERAPVSHIDRRADAQAGVIFDVLRSVPGRQVIGRGAIQNDGQIWVQGVRSNTGAPQTHFFLDGESRQEVNIRRGMLDQLDQGSHAQPVV